MEFAAIIQRGFLTLQDLFVFRAATYALSGKKKHKEGVLLSREILMYFDQDIAILSESEVNMSLKNLISKQYLTPTGKGEMFEFLATNAKFTGKKKSEKKKPVSHIPFEQRRSDFWYSLAPYKEKYGLEMLTAFFNWWSEKRQGVDVMRFEEQDFFEVSRRLATWKSKDKSRTNLAFRMG